MRTFLLIVVMLLSTAALARAELSVWVQPFTEANDQQQPDWITRSLHQSLIDELAATNGVRVSTATAKPADVQFVQFIVSAQIQRVSGELRVTGQVLDTATSKTVGGFKATGSERELFAIQDSIGTQVAKTVAPPPAPPAIPPAIPVVAATTMPAGAPQARIEAPFAPVRFGFEGSELQDAVRGNQPIQQRPIIIQEAPIYTQPVNNCNYGNGYYNQPYGYGFGWGYSSWPSVIVINQGGYGHHGGNGGGSMPSMPSGNGQAIRAVSGFGGKTPPPGVIMTMGR